MYINDIGSGFQYITYSKNTAILKNNFKKKILPTNLLSIDVDAKNSMCYTWPLTLEFAAFL